MLRADMAELADALVLGTSGLPVQVQVLLSAGVCKGFLSWYKVRSPFLIVYD